MFKFVVLFCVLVVSISCRTFEKDLSYDRVKRNPLVPDLVENGVVEEDQYDALIYSGDETVRVKRDTSSYESDTLSDESDTLSDESETLSDESDTLSDESDTVEVGLTISAEGEGKLEFDGIFKSLLGNPIHVHGEGGGIGGGVVAFGGAK